MHQKYGKLAWSEIIQPAIDLCEKGHLVSNYLGRVLKNQKIIIEENPSLSEIFINPSTNDVWIEGDIITRPVLAKTLKTIAVEGAKAIYNGSLTDVLVSDIKNFGGIITREDFLSYRVKWDIPVKTTMFNNFTVYSTPLPTSGSVLVFMLNILNGFLSSLPSVLNYHRIVETFKYAYAQRSALGDPDFELSAKMVCIEIFIHFILFINFCWILGFR